MGFVRNSSGRWIGAGVVGDFREEENWYYDRVSEEIPGHLENANFETSEEYGEAIEIHATHGKPERVFEVDWNVVGQALLDQEYDYGASDAADIGKRISAAVSSQHGDHLTEIRNAEPSVADELLDKAYSLVGSVRERDYRFEDFKEQNEEAWKRVEVLETEQAIEFVEKYSATPSVFRI